MKMLMFVFSFFVSLILKNVVCCFYPLIEASYSTDVISEKIRETSIRFSHLLFRITGTALIATEFPKMTVNAWVTDKDSGNIRKILTDIPMLALAKYSDILNGVAFVSTTDAYIYLPVGNLDLKGMDFNLEIKSNAALGAAMTLDVWALLEGEGFPCLEYQYRSVPLDAININDCMVVYDVATSTNSAVKTEITFGNGSQLTVPHKGAFAKCQAVSRLESANTFGLIYSDKDMAGGRNIKIRPDTTFNAFIVTYSRTLNG